MKAPKTRGERLRSARIEAGYSSSAGAALALGLKTASYNAHERAEQPGGRDYDPDQAKAYARKFKVEAGWLLTGEGRGPKNFSPKDHDPTGGHIDSDAVEIPPKASDPKRKKQVRLVGYVGAGAKAHLYAFAQESDYDMVDAIDGNSDQSVAVEIRGDSLGVMFDRWLVYYEDVRAPITEDMINKLCVVGLADDRILVKLIKARRDGGFDLISEREPPIEDAPIEWAAKVTNLVPR